MKKLIILILLTIFSVGCMKNDTQPKDPFIEVEEWFDNQHNKPIITNTNIYE